MYRAIDRAGNLVDCRLSETRDMTAAKARARVLEDFAVDHPHDGTGFVAVQLRVLPGRSQELKTRTAEAILEA